MAASVAGSMLAGGAIGYLTFGPGAASAEAPSSAPTVNTAAASVPGAVTGTASPGVDHSNSDPAHEAAETPAQEAAETAGQSPGGPGGHGGPGGPGRPGGHSNTDPAHEAAESPARAAQEAAQDAALPKGVTPTATPTP